MKKKSTLLLVIAVLSILLSACQAGVKSVNPVTGLPKGTDGYPWWNDTVFYEIFVRSFFDSNGDGVGDLNGITEKLDYLNDGDPSTTSDLGITGIWLMPIFPSPSYHGYDVIDYYGINPEYGTMGDFDNLLMKLTAGGIRVILDLVLNHSSIQNPWFQQAIDPQSPYHDWFIWSDTNPGYFGPWGETVWHYLSGKYYYGIFSPQMPDLNYGNPDVVSEMENVSRFWLEKGVDGFRLDAAKHIVEEGKKMANSPGTHEWWMTYHNFYRPLFPQAMTVGEIWEPSVINATYTQGDQLDLAFEFYLSAAFIRSATIGSATYAISQMQTVINANKPLQYAIFLSNHDENRVMSQTINDPQLAMTAASLLLSSPGVPFIYYGEEIGMEGAKPDERIRAPMQWSAGELAGFSTVSPWEYVGFNNDEFNVESETGDPNSILSHYRSLIQARNQHASLRVGELVSLTAGDPSLVASLRISKKEAILVLINLSNRAITDYELSVDASSLKQGNYSLYSILGVGNFPTLAVNTAGGFSGFVPVESLPPHSIYLLQLHKNFP